MYKSQFLTFIMRLKSQLQLMDTYVSSYHESEYYISCAKFCV